MSLLLLIGQVMVSRSAEGWTIEMEYANFGCSLTSETLINGKFSRKRLSPRTRPEIASALVQASGWAYRGRGSGVWEFMPIRDNARKGWRVTL